MRAWPKSRSRVWRRYGYCGTFQGEILFGCGSIPRSKDRGSAILVVIHVSVAQECVSLWIWLFHHQMNGHRIASTQRHSPGVVDHFQLTALLLIFIIQSLYFPLIILLLVTLQRTIIFEHESNRIKRKGSAESIGKLLHTGADLNVHGNPQSRAS
jgi:hypothetical protein